MQDQWDKLNDNKDNYDAFDEIYAGASKGTRQSSQMRKGDFSESDDDQFAKSSSNKDFSHSPQADTLQFKHASDAI